MDVLFLMSENPAITISKLILNFSYIVSDMTPQQIIWTEILHKQDLAITTYHEEVHKRKWRILHYYVVYPMNIFFLFFFYLIKSVLQLSN